jgi:hypothetical protein
MPLEVLICRRPERFPAVLFNDRRLPHNRVVRCPSAGEATDNFERDVEPENLSQLDREELPRAQEARCCAHFSLAHFRLKRATDLVYLSLNILELTSELQDVRHLICTVLGR